jgi:hypothetical protein
MDYKEIWEIPAAVFPVHDDPEIFWSSSDPSVASVENGIVAAHSPGSAVITAVTGNVSAAAEVTVYAKAEDFQIQDEVWVVAKGTRQLSVGNVIPDGADIDITWQCSDETVATVDESGRYLATCDVSAIDTAKYGKGKGQLSFFSGTQVKKTVIFYFMVERSIGTTNPFDYDPILILDDEFDDIEDRLELPHPEEYVSAILDSELDLIVNRLEGQS